MKRLLLIAPFLIVGCSKSPEEAEAAKYPAPKMMSEEEGKKQAQAEQENRAALSMQGRPK